MTPPADSPERPERGAPAADDAPQGPAKGDADTGRWWRNPSIVIPSVLAVVGLLVTLYFSLNPRSPKVADHLAACQRQHPAQVAITTPGAPDSLTFSGCVWPPIDGTDAAGHWVVRVRDLPIPGTAAADQFTSVQVFTTGCAALALDYVFDDQGSVAHSRFTVETNQTVSGLDGKTTNLFTGGHAPPQAAQAAQSDHLLVMTNLRYALKRVECVPLSAAPA